MDADRPLLIYHGGCFDGFTAAWLYARVYPDAELFPARYGDPPPLGLAKDRRVVVVDFSYPREQMEDLDREVRSLVVLDHHKTAEAALAGWQPANGICIFDMHRSGARLMLDWLRVCVERDNNVNMRDWLLRVAWFVDYIQDRDLWRNSMPGTHAVMAWVAAQEMTLEHWDGIAEGKSHEAVIAGARVMTYIDQYGRKARAEARLEVIAGHEVPTVNMPYMNCSEHVGALAEEYEGCPFAVGYFRRGDGHWQFSLRSRGESGFDVSEVAAKFGGGGHANAAGFDTKTLWEVFGGTYAG